MKGITPVIAIILLLLITVSMAGFAFIFLQRSLETATSSTESTMQAEINKQGQKFAIDNKDDTNNYIYIRHIGTITGDTANIFVYVNNQLATCVWDTPGVWPVNTIRRCTATFACTTTTKIEISTPGGRDAITC